MDEILTRLLEFTEIDSERCLEVDFTDALVAGYEFLESVKERGWE